MNPHYFFLKMLIQVKLNLKFVHLTTSSDDFFHDRLLVLRIDISRVIHRVALPHDTVGNKPQDGHDKLQLSIQAAELQLEIIICLQNPNISLAPTSIYCLENRDHARRVFMTENSNSG